MIDIKDINIQPTRDEMIEYINNILFKELIEIMETKYQAKWSIEYSKDTWLKGWNIKFRKSGKALCVVYPKRNSFTVLVVEGRKEREQFRAILPELSQDVQKVYHQSKEGMGQRWLMIDIESNQEVFQNILKLIEIRRTLK